MYIIIIKIKIKIKKKIKKTNNYIIGVFFL